MAKKLMSPEEYFHSNVYEYPTLYAHKNEKYAKLKVFDQLFNNIGNGINDELLEHLILPKIKNLKKKAIEYIKFPLYEGYKKYTLINDRKIPEGDYIVVTEKDKINHPEIVLWEELTFIDNNFKTINYDTVVWRPYPNFQKRYSLVWETPEFNTLSLEWFETAIWFYEQCDIFFKNHSSYYHSAYPSNDTKSDNRRIRELQEWKEKKYSSDKEFSDAYGVEYTGDMIDFVNRKWLKEKQRCEDMIKETLEMLHALRKIS